MRGHIRKRGNSWQVIIYVGRDQQTGRKRYKAHTHHTRREAEAHLTQLLAQVQAGGAVAPARLRLDDYLDQWLRDYATGAVGRVTMRNYGDTIHKHIAPALGHIPLSRLTPQLIQAYLSQKLHEGHLSSTSVQSHYGVLRKALSHATRWGLLSRNPAELVDPPRRRHVDMQVWDEEQVRLFLADAKRSSPYYGLYLAALLTGMRQGELLGLRWQDVDFLVGRLTVQHTFYRLGKEQLFREPKTRASRRTIDIAESLLEELRFLRDAQDGTLKRC